MSVGGEMALLEPCIPFGRNFKIFSTTSSLAMRLTFGGPQGPVQLVYSSEIPSGICKETSGRFQSKQLVRTPPGSVSKH